MAGNSGYIKLHRQILNWEWYHDINTFRLFTHILLKANYEDLTFGGHIIKRGQLACSLTTLSAQTGLSVRQVRVSLDKLKMTGEVTSSSNARYSVITIVHYDKYQSNGRLNDKQMTRSASEKGRADDRLMTGSMSRETATSKEYKEIKEDKEGKKKESPSSRERHTASRFAHPTLDEVRSFIQENGYQVDAEKWFSHYSSNGWMVGRNHMKDWQACIQKWDRDEKKPGKAAPVVKQVVAQQYTQREYVPAPASSFDDLYDRLDMYMGNNEEVQE